MLVKNDKGGRKQYYSFQPPHGWNKGIVGKSGIMPTIDSSIHFQHTLLIERSKQNMDMFLYNTIKQVCAEDGFNCGEREIKQVYEILHKESSWTIDKIENLLSGLEEKIADK